MITIESDPLLLDYIKIALAMPEDERKQLENFTGCAFTVDGCAMGNFQVTGHKWVIRDEQHEPLCLGGFHQERPGVWRDFMLTTPQAWEKYWFPITRTCRRIMDAMLISGTAHRIECITPARRLRECPALERWYRCLNYTREGVLLKYCADQDDAVIFSRVGHV